MKDVLAGLTVAAVALPLALAFGVSSGADAAAGMITAIVAGIVIGGLSGGSYQISGPTGAMSAILIGLSVQYGLQGVFFASFLSGILLLLASAFKVGKIVSFIPASVVTGFTSGIAVIIAGGQIDNFFGTVSKGSNLIEKIASYGTLGFPIHWQTVFFGLLVIGVMIIWPKKWQSVFPSSLAAILLALIIHVCLPFEVAEVGEIPSTLFPEVRLIPSQIPWDQMRNLVFPAISIAALGMIESLLCGASAGKMKHEPLRADRELFAQGIGNTILPFFGGVPATAAIARTSVAIKAGGQTRVVSIVHSLVLLASMFLLGPYMSKIPMAALAGVLMTTAWRMNEWAEIHEMWKKKLKTNMIQFSVTMIATIVFDLTIAILIGLLFSCLLFVVNNADLEISIEDIDLKRLDRELSCSHTKTKMVYLSGPMFFATQGRVKKALQEQVDEGVNALIFSMRGVPTIDDSGLQELKEIAQYCHEHHVYVILCGVSRNVLTRMERYELLDTFDNIVWDAINALTFVDELYRKEK
ncbi:SulP family inorganic anion transporter [Erysipelotrichaceae bacterium AM17-60]|nr:SulP family inorganic anion transporter [Erysipelotrichaceae bacterium AM17-60]